MKQNYKKHSLIQQIIIHNWIKNYLRKQFLLKIQQEGRYQYVFNKIVISHLLSNSLKKQPRRIPTR